MCMCDTTFLSRNISSSRLFTLEITFVYSQCAFRITVEVTCLGNNLSTNASVFRPFVCFGRTIAGRDLQKSPRFVFAPFPLLLFFFQRPQKPTFFCGELVVDSRPTSQQTLCELRGSDSLEKTSKNHCINHIIPARRQVSYTKNVGSLTDDLTANR
ncbi:hypothetical protein NL108_017153 [Boleophthalmus pectinirostris]|nr:hypothetical protein NL108_017153 [Boleophthalmus pectinirostris]